MRWNMPALRFARCTDRMKVKLFRKYLLPVLHSMQLVGQTYAADIGTVHGVTRVYNTGVLL